MISFLDILTRVYPRVLTQVSRDPNSTTYGCFDRNWWHYKIRDFASIILQQGGYFISQVSDLKDFDNHKQQLDQISIASVYFWARRTLRRGSHEEYYPWEDGYPPLAFSTLAMAKLIEKYEIKDRKINKALKKSTRKLLNRFEPQAANQQIAGLAALAVIKRIRPEFINEIKYNKLSASALELQDSEGWFVEYGGPDLGYLSVTLDCLWDLYDYTLDTKYVIAARKAFCFLSKLVMFYNGSLGMHNARNTDYIVPYGLSRFLNSDIVEEKEKAHTIFNILYNENYVNSIDHFLHAIDDRYWAHYVGHSIVRAEKILQLFREKNAISKTIFHARKIENNFFFKNSGFLLINSGELKVFINCRKGGIFTVKFNDNYYTDFGWIVKRGKKQYVHHWWSNGYQFDIRDNSIVVRGKMVLHIETLSNPYYHFILRLISFFIGRRIISILKKSLIFKKGKSNYAFERKIDVEKKKITINDTIFGIRDNDIIEKAPRSSKRHVSSADSFHPEDFERNQSFEVNGFSQRLKNKFLTTTNIITP